MFYLFIRQLMDIWVFPTLAITDAIAVSIHMFLCRFMFSFLLDTYLGVALVDHMVSLFSFLRNCQTVLSRATPFFLTSF